MGCKVSKSGVEPCGASKILECNKLSRSYSTPIQLANVQHSLQNSKCESFHIVSLTSSTYGSLPPDSMPHPEEWNKADIGTTEQGGFERIKNGRDLHAARVPYSWSHEIDLQTVDPSQNAIAEAVIPQQKDADYKQEETVNMWELMESLEDKKAALHMLQGLMGKSRVSGLDSGKSSPRMSSTIHTVEELDNILDVRRSYPTNHRFQRESWMEPLIPAHDSHKFELDSKKMHGTPFSVQLSQLSLAMEKSREAKEFDSVRRKDFFQSQELNSKGRNDLFYRQDLDSVRRSNLTRSQEFDSIRRFNISREQGLDFARTNLSRSQEFVRPPLSKPKGVVAPRQSLSEVRTAVRVGDYERKIATSQPDPVLRSPMLQGLSGRERLGVRPGQQSPLSSLASPKLSGLHQTSSSLDEAPVVDSNIPISSKRSTVKAITPATINASQRAAEYSSLRSRNCKDTSAHVAVQPAMSKYLMSKSIDDSQGINTKTNHSVLKIPPIDDKTELIVLRKPTQDVGNISTVKQSGWSSSSSNTSTSSSTTSSSTATSRAPRKTMPLGILNNDS